MPMTRKLYEETPACRAFTATVTGCTAVPGGWAVVLDATAFFPAGGGQPCDTGTLGGAAVAEVTVDGAGVVTHRTDAPLPVGGRVTGTLDWARRLDHMQQHTGEHILSGTLHRLFGCENVGFHIGEPAVRMDLSLPVTDAGLAEAERLANEAVQADLPVRCWYPGPAALAAAVYRSKKELEGPVRLTEIPGVDCCACCGTHLATTGQVGLIKITSAQNYKGGTRLAVACGMRAVRAVQALAADEQSAGALLSAPAGGLSLAVERLLAAGAAEKQRLAALQSRLAEALCQTLAPGAPAAARLAWADGADGDGLRRLALAMTAVCALPCGAFAPGGQGLAYALAAPAGTDLRPLCAALNGRFGGRGGGKPGFCQGSLPPGNFDAVRAFLAEAGF